MSHETREKKHIFWIPVVVALIRKNQTVLVGQRPHGNGAGRWEFPGGKIEPQETPEEALHRELWEELGIDAEIGDCRFACNQFYQDTAIMLLFYEVLFWKGEPKLQHHLALQWVPVDQLATLQMPDVNQRYIMKIMKALGS